MPELMPPLLASLLLRVALAALFISTAVPKFQDPKGTSEYFVGLFAKTWLPTFMVRGMAAVAGPVELLIALWLLVGWQLPFAWLFAGLWTVALAIGMSVASQFQQAAANFIYIGVCAGGILLSPFDRFHF
jgi:uncharacterized membrane protein YphA (DoxX/SURF4 family)